MRLFLDTTAQDIVEGFKDKNIQDIEDAYQYYTAQSSGCNFLITNNIKDFKETKKSQMSVVTPKEFLER